MGFIIIVRATLSPTHSIGRSNFHQHLLLPAYPFGAKYTSVQCTSVHSNFNGISASTSSSSHISNYIFACIVLINTLLQTVSVIRKIGRCYFGKWKWHYLRKLVQNGTFIEIYNRNDMSSESDSPCDGRQLEARTLEIMVTKWAFIIAMAWLGLALVGELFSVST